jgi:hypothetical protein
MEGGGSKRGMRYKNLMLGLAVAADSSAAKQGQQVHRHLDLTKAKVQAKVSLGVALARTAKNGFVLSVYSHNIHGCFRDTINLLLITN